MHKLYFEMNPMEKLRFDHDTLADKLAASEAQYRNITAWTDAKQASYESIVDALERLCAAKNPLDWSPSTEIAEAFANARAALAKAKTA
mgnify:CR=1 FL=1